MRAVSCLRMAFVFVPILVLASACSMAEEPSASREDALSTADAGVDSGAIDCAQIHHEVCKLYRELRSAVSPDGRSCSESCVGVPDSFPVNRVCYDDCVQFRCAEIEGTHKYRNYLDAKKTAKLAGCKNPLCADPCDAL